MKTSKLFFSNIIYYYQVSNTNIKTLVFADNPSRNISRNLFVSPRSTSSRWRFFIENILKNFLKFTGKHLCQRLSFNKVTARPASLLKKILQQKCFLVNLAKNFKNTFLQNTSERLLLMF